MVREYVVRLHDVLANTSAASKRYSHDLLQTYFPLKAPAPWLPGGNQHHTVSHYVNTSNIKAHQQIAPVTTEIPFTAVAF